MIARPAAVFALVFSMTPACSSPYEGATTSFDVPSEAGFDAVTTPLVYFCGSLDCHGQIGRNLRLYGMQGLRLDPKDVPCGAHTSQAEIDADYQTVIGLEPEVMAQVVHDGGADPERLTLVRKARGTEKHTGGAVFPKDSEGDLCITQWIAGKPDEAGAHCRNTIPQNPRPLCVP